MVNMAKFDRDEVVRQAMLLFWKQGYHATSMRGLQSAVNLRPGSIYSSFGGKDDLYRESLLCYTQASLHRLDELRESVISPLSALEDFIWEMITNQDGSAASDMCFLVKTVLELNEDHDNLVLIAKDALKKMETGFANLVIEAQHKGEVRKERDPHELACFIQVQLIGMRAYKRFNKDQSGLRLLLQNLISYLKDSSDSE